MKRRFIISYAFLFAMFTLGIGTSIYLHWRSTRELERVVEGHQIEELRQVLSFRVHMSQQDLQVSGTAFANQLDHIVDNVKALDESVQTCFECHHSDATSRELVEVVNLVERYKEQFSTFITAILSEEQRSGLQLEASDTAAELNERIDRMMMTTGPILKERTQAGLAEVARSWRVLAITLVLTLAGAIVVTLTLAESVTRPVDKLLAGTSRIAAGDLGYQIAHDDRDEMGALMDSFNQMSAALRRDQQRIDGYVSRLRRLIRAVFSLRATPDTEALRPRLTRAMEELVEAEVYGSVLRSDLANVCVLSLQRFGDTSPFHQVGLSCSRLEKIQGTGPESALIVQSGEDVEWPFSGLEGKAEVRDFVIAWMEHEEELSGALVAINKKTGSWLEEDAEVLSALGQGVAEALENIRLFQGLKSRIRPEPEIRS